MTRSLTFALLAIAVLSLSACGGSATSDPDAADVPSEADVQAVPTGAWVLDVAQSDLEFPSESTATMLLGEDGTFSGTSPCNDLGGQADVAADGSWSLREFSWDDAGCDEATQEAQDAFFAALQATTSWERTGDSTLVLADGSKVLTFRADEPLDTDVLLGTTWEVVSIDTSDESRPVPGDGPTPTFTYLGDASGGTFTQHTGCREATGNWVARGGRVDHTAWSQLGDTDAFEDCSEDQLATEQAVDAAVAGGFRLDAGANQVVFRSARDTRNAIVLQPANEGADDGEGSLGDEEQRFAGVSDDETPPADDDEDLAVPDTDAAAIARDALAERLPSSFRSTRADEEKIEDSEPYVEVVFEDPSGAAIVYRAYQSSPPDADAAISHDGELPLQATRADDGIEIFTVTNDGVFDQAAAVDAAGRMVSMSAHGLPGQGVDTPLDAAALAQLAKEMLRLE